MSTVKTLAEDFAGEGCLLSIGNAAILEDDLIIDSFAAVTALFFNEDGRPMPSEIASSAPGPEEGHLRLELERFLSDAKRRGADVKIMVAGVHNDS